MTTTIVICLTVIIIVAIICYTHYKCQNNATYDELLRKVDTWVEQLIEAERRLDDKASEILKFRFSVQELLTQLKLQKENENQHPRQHP